MKIEGLLMNVRAVQGIFDDLNPETRASGRTGHRQVGPGAQHARIRGRAARVAPARRAGLHGQPAGRQPRGLLEGTAWENTAIDPDGNLRPDYMSRLARILDRADELGMVAIVGYFYFGQDQRVSDEAAVRRAVTNATNWLLERDYRNVLVEIDNECNVAAYDHEILKPERVHELIELAQEHHRDGRRMLVGTSYGGGAPARANVVKASDFLLLHGNGPDDPARIRRMIQTSRQAEGYRPMPVLINEDDHFRFDEPENHMMTALEQVRLVGLLRPRGLPVACPCQLGHRHRPQAAVLHQDERNHRRLIHYFSDRRRSISGAMASAVRAPRNIRATRPWRSSRNVVGRAWIRFARPKP